ncbi:hypothetical protein [Nocardia asiatica]|uniref:hypothetical protein n=1 Tax=Nocardia asiatica TaxID=209252 RepID=UPI0012FC4C8A|nr:hypothetical protein [Nocardia asiatica]
MTILRIRRRTATTAPHTTPWASHTVGAFRSGAGAVIDPFAAEGSRAQCLARVAADRTSGSAATSSDSLRRTARAGPRSSGIGPASRLGAGPADTTTMA